MAANPLISQGTLNRLIGSVVIPNFPNLNVTAPYLGKAGIRLALEGEATATIPTLTGAVMSPEPYQVVSVTVNLLKTQALAGQWKAQHELTTLIGAFNVIPDTSVLPAYLLVNGSIKNVGELNFSGEDPGFVIMLTGYYQINSSLWNLV